MIGGDWSKEQESKATDCKDNNPTNPRTAQAADSLKSII